MKVKRWFRRRFRQLVGATMTRLALSCAGGGVAGIARLGDRIGRWHYRIRPLFRRHLQDQMGRALKVDNAAVTVILRESFRVSDRAAFEVLALGARAIRDEDIMPRVAINDLDPLRRVLSEGRGALLLSLHGGNPIALVIRLARLGLPISIVANNTRIMPRGFFGQALETCGAEFIPARPQLAAYYGFARALKRGRAVLVTMDQAHNKGGIPCHFLDKAIPMPAGPAALARSLNVPIFPVLPVAAEPLWQFQIDGPRYLPEHGDRAQDVAFLAAILDRHIRQYPQFWSWHHRRWRKFPFIDEPSAARSEA